MAGQLRFYTPNNLRRNLAGPQYPDKITLRGRNIDFFTNISPLLDTIDELNGRASELVLEKDLFSVPWGLIVDLLFPNQLSQQHKPSHELFLFRENGFPYLNPNRSVTYEDLQEIIDYFLIGHPREINETLLQFAYRRPGAPERPHNAYFTVSPAKELAERREKQRAYRQSMENSRRNNFSEENNNSNFINYNNENENQGPELGYTEEEEEVLGKLKGANVGRYFRGGKKSRRKTRKLKKKTRKH
jgi:hypothetical protein